MGECLIIRRGGEKYELPILNSAYPTNVTQLEKSGGSATFNVVIATPGKPAEYTYQWYVNGSKVSGATGSSYTKTGLTSAATYTVYCEVTNKAGTVQSRIATLTVQSSQPVYTYSGSHELIKENTYNWKIKLKSTGNLKFTHLGNCTGLIDVFLVGGGAGGSNNTNYNTGGGGGGGGRTTNTTANIQTGVTYAITVGGGGSPDGGGGQTSAFSKTAAGGSASSTAHHGGSGGSGGGGAGWSHDLYAGVGGSNGGSGGAGAGSNYSTGAGAGQGTTTKEFGSGTLYAGGGAGGAGISNGDVLGPCISGGSGGGGRGAGSGGAAGAGTANTGGGGGGSRARVSHLGNSAASGGSGIVVIRNHR